MGLHSGSVFRSIRSLLKCGFGQEIASRINWVLIPSSGTRREDSKSTSIDGTNHVRINRQNHSIIGNLGKGPGSLRSSRTAVSGLCRSPLLKVIGLGLRQAQLTKGQDHSPSSSRKSLNFQEKPAGLSDERPIPSLPDSERKAKPACPRTKSLR